MQYFVKDKQGETSKVDWGNDEVIFDNGMVVKAKEVCKLSRNGKDYIVVYPYNKQSTFEIVRCLS